MPDGEPSGVVAAVLPSGVVVAVQPSGVVVAVQPSRSGVTVRRPFCSEAGKETALRPMGTLVATAMPRCWSLLTAQ